MRTRINATLALALALLWSCEKTEENAPDVFPNERQEMLEVMDYTAQVVSQVLVSNKARQEVLGYAFVDRAGEVEATFEELLSGTPNGHKGLANGAETGNFAERFRPRAAQYQFEKESPNRSSSIDNVISNLEGYLKEHNLGIFGPYLAENHANSNKPITVSFDPLDDSKTTNYGYMLVPKSTSGSSANLGSIDAPLNFDDYELIRIDDIDDDYAYDNPTIAIIELDYPGSGTYSTPPSNPITNFPSNTNPISIPTNGIDCDDLLAGDFLRPYMHKFRLTDNLRSGFWNQNLLDMYAVTADDVTFDLNDVATVNPSSTKWWSGVKVSRKDAKDKKWKDANQMLDNNWTLDELNMVLVVAYKKSSVDLKISTDVSGIFDGEPKLDIGAELDIEEKRELLTNFPIDKCLELKLFRTPSPVDPDNELHVYKAGNFEFTLEVEWRR